MSDRSAALGTISISELSLICQRYNVRLSVQRLCLFVTLPMVTDGEWVNLATVSPRSGPSAARYLLTVFLDMPNSLEKPRTVTPQLLVS